MRDEGIDISISLLIVGVAMLVLLALGVASCLESEMNTRLIDTCLRSQPVEKCLELRRELK